jgi:hypothetical protein
MKGVFPTGPSAEEAQRRASKQKGIPQEENKRAGAPKVLPAGIPSRQAQRARAIAAHSAEVEEVIREAEENEDIPTKTVLTRATKIAPVLSPPRPPFYIVLPSLKNRPGGHPNVTSRHSGHQ